MWVALERRLEIGHLHPTQQLDDATAGVHGLLDPRLWGQL